VLRLNLHPVGTPRSSSVREGVISVAHGDVVEMRPRTLWMMVAIGLGLIVLLVGLLRAGERSSGAATAATRASCAQSVHRLREHLHSLDAQHPNIDAKIARASFRACASPDAWRVGAEKAGVAAALGALVGDPGLATDRALDTLCTHLDTYETTRVCKAREGANLRS